MKALEEERAQTSIEMLILIGGAVAIAAIVGVLLKNAATSTAEKGSDIAGEAVGG